MNTSTIQELSVAICLHNPKRTYVDVRLPAEYRAQHIAVFENIPLHTLEQHINSLKEYEEVYLICASGNRSGQAQKLLEAHGIHTMNVLGGMNAWVQAKLPVVSAKHTLPMMRQIMLAAGILILSSLLFALLFSPYWLLLTTFVGLGLTVSGLTGFCGMAYILASMPWNKESTSNDCSTASTSCCIPIKKQTSTKLTYTDFPHASGAYTIRQFFDADLAHYSYALLSENKIALVDPARNPAAYYAFAKEKNADIVAIFETHPHADFVSSHAEIAQKTGAVIYVSHKVGARYEHTPVRHNDKIGLGNIECQILETPGHSPDSISIAVLVDNTVVSLFSGDTLFVGDVGRPDLRETAGNMTAEREQLAASMHETIHSILVHLPNETVVYPAHGAGSLCGKSLGAASFTTIGAEKSSNPAFLATSKEACVQYLLDGQPFIPPYFIFDVETNVKGASELESTLKAIPVVTQIAESNMIIDARSAVKFAAGHIKNAINIPNDTGFVSWLGTIVHPHETFYVIVENETIQIEVLQKIAKIGYESLVSGVAIGLSGSAKLESVILPIVEENYTIIDVRHASEFAKKQAFATSINIPLPELRSRLHEIAINKPILVHCAAGYRSSIATSIIQQTGVDVFDVGVNIKTYL